MATRAYVVTPAVVEQRRAAATVHGARSEAQVRDAARAQKRRLLRRMGRKAADLDVIATVYVDLLARALAKVALLDRHYAEVGLLRKDGQAQASLALYVTLLSSARLAAQRLSEHLVRQGQPAEELEEYLVARYSRSGDVGGAGE